MAGTMGEEEIVEGNEEIGGRKRVNNDKDDHPAKRAQLEGNEAAGCRNIVTCGDKEEVEEGEPKENVDRLRGLFEGDPKKLGNKDVEDVIRYLDVDEIISLALKSDQGNGSEQFRVAEVEKWTKDEGGREKVAVVVRKMLCYIEIVKRAEFRLLYEKLPPKAFTTLVLAAMDANKIRRARGRVPSVPLAKAEERDIMPKLCCVLPWKLFAHVLNEKSWVPRFDDEPDEEEKEEEECTPLQKEAAENCGICFGKGRHADPLGLYCSFEDAIPKGTRVGTNYWIACSNCGYLDFTNSFERCSGCDCEVGKAVRIPSPRSYSDSTHKDKQRL